MSHQFKPGDLAVIVGTVRDHETLGRTVELLEYLGDDDAIEVPTGGWVNNVERNRMWWVCLVDGAYTNSLGHTKSEGPCREQFLLPLRGDFVPAEEKSQAVSA
jgi:hypothetical protein